MILTEPVNSFVSTCLTSSTTILLKNTLPSYTLIANSAVDKMDVVGTEPAVYFF